MAKIKRQLYQRAAERKKETAQDRFGRKTANATVWIAILTFVVAAVGALQYSTFKGQLAVMQRQLNAMEADQRPWVYADVSVGGDLQFDQFGGLPIPITFVLHNTGRTPALLVSPEFQVHSFTALLSSHSLASTQADYCKLVKTKLQNGPNAIGVALFPGDTKTITATATMPSSEIKEEQEKFPLPGSKKEWVTPAVVGCIDYKFASALEHHQTGFGYQVGVSEFEGEAFSGGIVPITTKTIPKNLVWISPILPGGNLFFAD